MYIWGGDSVRLPITNMPRIAVRPIPFQTVTARNPLCRVSLNNSWSWGALIINSLLYRILRACLPIPRVQYTAAPTLNILRISSLETRVHFGRGQTNANRRVIARAAWVPFDDRVNRKDFFTSLLATVHNLRARFQATGSMDLEASQPAVKSEFIAVVLAGFGRE